MKPETHVPHLAAAARIAAGDSHVAAGRAVGLSRQAVGRLLRKPAFRALVERLRIQAEDRIAGRLAHSALAAVETLREQLGSPDSEISIRAATILLEKAVDFGARRIRRTVASTS